MERPEGMENINDRKLWFDLEEFQGSFSAATLRSICRFKIRKCMTTKLARIADLPLPAALKDYLKWRYAAWVCIHWEIPNHFSFFLWTFQSLTKIKEFRDWSCFVGGAGGGSKGRGVGGLWKLSGVRRGVYERFCTLREGSMKIRMRKPQGGLWKQNC